MSKADGSAEWTFTYDADGMRTGRSDGTTTYGYVYNGGQLTQMTVGSDTLTFGYDASGRPQTLTLGGETYYYVTNLQGDVTSITDSSGTWLVHYYYGGYGNTYGTMNANEVARATPLMQLNPLVYRGYVYDRETRLFYLQSRYYNPRIGRFINADALVATGQGLLGNNMFAYCRNNPVIRVDISGTEDMEMDLDGNNYTEDEHLAAKNNTSSTGSSGGPRLSFLGGHAAPNSGGRLGGPLHRAMVDTLKRLFKAFGYDVSEHEQRVNIEGTGKYRYPDVIATRDGKTVYIQVGRSTSSGDPIAREQRAIDDLRTTGNFVLFFPYDD